MLWPLLCMSFSYLCHYSKWLGSSESVPLLFSGASFTFIIPSAFVTLSASALTELTPRRRLRIIAAGPFHNILLWCILLTVKQTGLGSVIWTVGYRNLGPIGKIVLRVDHVSNDLQRFLLFVWLQHRTLLFMRISLLLQLLRNWMIPFWDQEMLQQIFGLHIWPEMVIGERNF